MNNRFSKFTENILRKAGWFPGRNMPETVTNWKAELQKTDNKEMFAEAEKILLEFGRLKIKQGSANNPNTRSYFEINPSLVVYEGDRFEDFEKVLETTLYPLGEAESGHVFLAVSEDGRIFLVMMDLWFVANSFDEALENLILGKMPEWIA